MDLINLKAKIKEFLRRIERYTKTDMVYFVRNGFWSLLNQVIGSASSAIVTIMLANMLSKEYFGQYRFVLSIISILVVFILPGINTAVMRSVARGNKVDLPKAVKIEICWGVLGSAIALCIAAYYFWNNDFILSFALILTALFLPFLEPFSIYSAYYKGKQNFRTATIYESGSRLFQAAALILVAFITKDILAIIGAFFVSQIISRLFFYVKTLKDEKFEVSGGNIDKKQFDETIKYGKMLTTTQLSDAIVGNIDKLIVWYFLGAEILAIYYIALTIPNNIILIFNIIPRIAFPRFSKNIWEAHERARIMYKLFIFFAALVIPTLLYFLLAPLVIPFIFKDYGASIPAAIILSFLIFISPLNALINQIFQARKLLKNMFFLQTIAFITFIIVFFIMYRKIGANPIDAAIALTISEAISLFAGIWLIRRWV